MANRFESFSSHGRSDSLFSHNENLLILEKALEQNGQDWIENLNTIEQLLVRIVDKIGRQDSTIKSNFIIRRLPTYLSPFINKNEYGIVLEDLEFSLSPPTNTTGRASPSSIDRPGSVNFGQLEIFYVNPETEDSLDEDNTNKSETSSRFRKAEIVNDSQAYCSHEIFKRFASAFVDAYHFEMESENKNQQIGRLESGKVQLLGPHLLFDVRKTPDVEKIFTLIQPPLSMNKDTKSKCTVNVNYLKSLITVAYEDSEATVRPCLFYERGYPKVNANISERLPLYHPSFLNCAESLTKGFLLVPTSFETLWTLQYWTSESHLISKYHPGSLICRVLKLYSAFCLNPIHFWETLNTSFLVGINEMDSFIIEDSKMDLLNTDFMISSFAFELEDFSEIEDWAPRNFSTRLMHLLRSAVDSYEKGYHSHYFTKINVLRGIWKNATDHFEKDEKSALRELDDITEDLDDYGERKLMEIDDLADDFGLHFEDLDTFGEDDIEPRLTSEMIYKSLNPFQSMDNEGYDSYDGLKGTTRTKKPNTLSKMFGSNLARKISNRVTRRHSDAGNKNSAGKDFEQPQDKMQSLTDIASGFEESVAQMRRQESLSRQYGKKHNFSNEKSSRFTETSFFEGKYSPYDDSDLAYNRKPSSSKIIHTTQHEYGNEGFDNNHATSVYSALLQNLNNLPPSDYLSDQEMIAYLEQSNKVLQAQEELITTWSKAILELPKPKVICPHIFSQRQIQYLSLVIQSISRCSPNMVKIIKISKMPVWEISGDILRTVLHQMRTEVTNSESLREKQRPKVVKARSFMSVKGKSQETEEHDNPQKSTKKFSFTRKTNNSSGCKHFESQDEGFAKEINQDGDSQFALEEPVIAATLRLLEWLWQLRCSEMGRLSSKAQKYLEELFKISMINSHFLEQFTEESVFKSMALRSAVAVTRIMADEKFPAHVPLYYAATNKGWLWAEMVLSLASWNKEKGIDMEAFVPLTDPHPITDQNFIIRSIGSTNMRDLEGTLRKKVSKIVEISNPDIDAATLAFHSEMATPIGWNDFEDPRRSGPYTASILIFSSMGYFKHWEMIPGNIVQALVRLQKFNSLQHVGTMLSSPHRKTALNEVRKSNKSISFRMYNFEENVMSKTFKRLASLRNTRRKVMKSEFPVRKYYSCEEVGCHNKSTKTGVKIINGTQVECTRL